MAIRTVREVGDAVLTKVCREVKEMTPRIDQLIDDMFDTMYEYNGVGLAAPQVGVLRRIIVVDVGDDPRVLINPKIVETEGTQTGDEGCLSYPGKFGTVTRPMRVVVEGLDREMNPVRWERKVFSRGISVMRSTTWTDICIWKRSRVKSTMFTRWKNLRKQKRRMRNENSIYGNSGFCCRNTGCDRKSRI